MPKDIPSDDQMSVEERAEVERRRDLDQAAEVEEERKTAAAPTTPEDEAS